MYFVSHILSLRPSLFSPFSYSARNVDLPFTLLAFVFIGVWVVGIPLGIFVMLWKNKKYLHQEDSYTEEEQKKHDEVVAEFGTLYLQYEREYWWFEIVVIFKKMLLTGPMVIMAAGSSVQIVLALVIVLFNMLLILKTAPFEDATDDWLSFLTSLQMFLTLIAGLLIKTDNPSNPTYESKSTGVILIALNSLGMVALFLSILGMIPCVRRKINSLDLSDEAKAKIQKEVEVSINELNEAKGLPPKFDPPKPPPPTLPKEELDVHQSNANGITKLYKSGKISEKTAKKVRVLLEMCKNSEITDVELIHMMKKWCKRGQIKEEELIHILQIYGEDYDANDSMVQKQITKEEKTLNSSSSTKVTPIINGSVDTANSLAKIRQEYGASSNEYQTALKDINQV